MPDTEAPDVTPYDALLLLSFGGPEAPEDVVPFLENVTRGRGIPRERLEEVGQHYHLFGGRSPINDQNRALLAAIREDLAGAGIDLPVYWGNRNWDPYLADAAAADARRRGAAGRGVRHQRLLLLLLVPAVPREPRRRPAPRSPPRARGVPTLDRFRQYYNHPGFVEPVVDATLAALAELPEAVRDEARLVFVTHSIPEAMNDASGPAAGRTSPSTAAGSARSSTGCARRPGAGTTTTSSTARAPARRRCRGSSPTSTTTSRSSRRAGRRRWC